MLHAICASESITYDSRYVLVLDLETFVLDLDLGAETESLTS